MSKIDYFKSEDFPVLKDEALDSAVKWANAKLQALIEAAPVVYGNMVADVYNGFCSMRPMDEVTHSARLMFIEKLPVKECEHTHVILRGEYMGECRVCNKILRQKWEAV